MDKQDRALLKEIYNREYAKASTKEKKKSLEYQIKAIERKAREDAQRKHDVRVKTKAKKKSGVKYGKTMKRVGKRSQQVSDDIMDMLSF